MAAWPWWGQVFKKMGGGGGGGGEETEGERKRACAWRVYACVCLRMRTFVCDCSTATQVIYLFIISNLITSFRSSVHCRDTLINLKQKLNTLINTKQKLTNRGWEDNRFHKLTPWNSDRVTWQVLGVRRLEGPGLSRITKRKPRCGSTTHSIGVFLHRHVKDLSPPNSTPPRSPGSHNCLLNTGRLQPNSPGRSLIGLQWARNEPRCCKRTGKLFVGVWI